MEPQVKKSSKKLSTILFVLVVAIVIAASVYVFQNNQYEMAPGDIQIEETEPVLIAENEAVDMPSPVVPESKTKSFGTMETANGNFEVVGLTN